jgi:hypothetical protein
MFFLINITENFKNYFAPPANRQPPWTAAGVEQMPVYMLTLTE